MSDTHAAGNIVNIEEYRTAGTSDLNPERIVARGKINTETGLEGRPGSAQIADFSDLYSPETPKGGLVHYARRLLADVYTRIETAKQLLADGDTTGCDNEISLIQADLPDLFCCGELLDGLEAVTLALHHGLRNLHGNLPTENQIYALSRVVEKVRADPFLQFSSALDLIDDLIEHEFKTDPPEAELLSELFEGVR